MTAAFAVTEGFESADARRKRLGQYFSGLPVAKLLVALCSNRRIRTVIDPMGGRGDMLLAAQSILTGCKHISGIEIDPLAHSECVARFGDANKNDFEFNYTLGNAFDSEVTSSLLSEGYDLVVTNPPYVRYQSQRNSAGHTTKMPSALEVRNGLIRCLEQRRSLPENDRETFMVLAQEYSGLADLAVPSWILCAALVKPGGTLAVVVPDAWLNRDYAAVIRYLLLRCFHIEFIIEDAHAAWFPDAQVKTTLLVARRVSGCRSIRAWGAETYLHMMLPSQSANQVSLVGRTAFGAARLPERAFAKQARAILSGCLDIVMEGCAAHRIRLSDQVSAVGAVGASDNWFKRLEPSLVQEIMGRHVVPSMLASWFDKYRDFVTLGELGVNVGQGLRTGANEFFYVEKRAARNETATVLVSKSLGGTCIEIPSDCIRSVVRKQSDLPEGHRIDIEQVHGAVLAFHGWALPEDAKTAMAKPLPDECSEFIRRAANATVSGKPLPTLSAVAPNVRPANIQAGMPARYWYMLPNFSPRHSPDVFLARVNSLTPRAFLNPGRAVLIDANFTTLWLSDSPSITAHALLAVLSSSIAAALFEFVGAVMGGGALKLEATHLRSLPLPRLSAVVWENIHELGSQLETTSESGRAIIVNKIDRILCAEMFGKRQSLRKLDALHSAIRQRQSARCKGLRTV